VGEVPVEVGVVEIVGAGPESGLMFGETAPSLPHATTIAGTVAATAASKRYRERIGGS
jgi:hypothetical protein